MPDKLTPAEYIENTKLPSIFCGQSRLSQRRLHRLSSFLEIETVSFPVL